MRSLSSKALSLEIASYYFLGENPNFPIFWTDITSIFLFYFLFLFELRESEVRASSAR